MAKKKASQIDVAVSNEGSLFLFTPLTPEAKQWVKDNVPLESWQWYGDGFAVEPRYSMTLVKGIQAAGLVVE